MIFLLLIFLLFDSIRCQIQLSKEYVNQCANQLQNNQANSTICSFPKSYDGFTVSFYMLQGSFPFNAPSDLIDNAGIEFRSSVQAHAGIGIILESFEGACSYSPNNPKRFGKYIECVQFSIEFAANNYTGAIFPDTSNHLVTWNNNASIYLTNPINSNQWINSKLLTITTGYIYNQYVLTILKNISYGYFDTYQPITILQPNITTFENVIPVAENNIGDLLTYPSSSYTFVNQTTSFLLSKQCIVSSLLAASTTNFFYFSNSIASVTLAQADNEYKVSQWYADLYSCFKKNATKFSINGVSNGATFMAALPACYHSYAYVYGNTGMVYNVSLYKNIAADIYTPLLFRFLLSSSSSSQFISPTMLPLDYIILIIFAFVFVIYCGFLTTRLTKAKTSTSHKELEGRFLDRIYETYGNENTLKEWNITLTSKSSTNNSFKNEINKSKNHSSGSWNRSNMGRKSTDDIDVGLLTLNSDNS
jgi:uncharacterized membrane protein